MANCTTLRIYYNQAPPVGQGWGLMNYTPCCGWSGSADPTNIHDTYADYTWGYPYNQGTNFVVLQNGDTISSPFTIDFSITQPTNFPTSNSVEETGYEFLPGSNLTSATVRIYYNQTPPSGGWGLVNWQNHTDWSGAAGPTNIHDTYADYTFEYPYVPSSSMQYILTSSNDASSVFAIDWSALPTNTAPSVQSLSNTTLNQGDTYSTNGSFTDSDSTSWTATVDYGDGSGTQPLSLSGTNFSLSHQYNAGGTYTVTVSVTDNQGAIGTRTATITVTPAPLTPVADSYTKQGSQNENEGASTFLRLQSSGHNRALIKFDESQIQAAVGNSQNYTATLQFTISDNGNNWGTNGRTIEIHRLLQNWTEGNGFIDGNSPANRGTGSGVTWNCAIDTNISNQATDCSGTTTWNMDNSSLWPFASAVTASTTITNNQSGTISFNVTSDVQSFIAGTNQNDGWLLKKTDEGANGRIQFGSKESTNSPQLVITKN